MKINPYKIRLAIAGIVGVLSILAVCGLFYPVKFMDIQFVPLLQRLFFDFSVITAVLFVGIIILTLIFGRFYCSTICPFGILQEFVAVFISKITKNSFPGRGRIGWGDIPVRYLIAGLTFGALFGGSALLIRYIEPYTIFGSAFSLSIFGIIFVLVILAIVFFKNRFFCTNICPVGAVLGLISSISLNKIYMDENCVKCGMCAKNCPSGCIHKTPHPNPPQPGMEQFVVDNETCVKCLKCFSVCPKGAIKYGIDRTPHPNPPQLGMEQKVKFNPKRRDFVWGMGALAFLGAGYAIGINFAKNLAKKVKDVILPAGAVNANRMANKCLNCNLCINNCPNGILSKSDDKFSTVHIDYEKGKHYCKYDCHKCSEVCPSGAIKKISLEEKQNTRIGMASVSPHCIGCENCVKECPTGAISINEKRAVVDGSKCIGCGKCATVCKPQAIQIYGVNDQSKI